VRRARRISSTAPFWLWNATANCSPIGLFAYVAWASVWAEPAMVATGNAVASMGVPLESTRTAYRSGW
jgi:hypothetical protein